MDGWKKNLYTTWGAETLVITGFLLVMPFLPYYIQELGIKDLKQVAFWAGILGTATGFMLIISTPLWGILADRFGRKIILVRAMLAACIILFLMGIARNIQQLLILRLMQGLLTGTITSAIALVSSISPRRHAGYSLGIIQTSTFIGASVGPLLGGIAADFWGYRNSFFLSSALAGIALLIVIFRVKEKFIRPGAIPGKEPSRRKRIISMGDHFPLILLMLFLTQFSIFLIAPIFPIFVQKIISPSSHLASTAGIILALSGLTSALSAIITGKLRDKIGAYKKIIIPAMLLSGVFYILQSFSKDVVQLLWFRIGYGLMVGGIIPLINTIIYSITSRETIGKNFGIAGSISALGMAIGPLTGGIIASVFTIKTPFLLGGIGLLATGVITFFILGHIEEKTQIGESRQAI